MQISRICCLTELKVHIFTLRRAVSTPRRDRYWIPSTEAGLCRMPAWGVVFDYEQLWRKSCYKPNLQQNENLPELQWKTTCQNPIRCLRQTLNPLVVGLVDV